MASLVRRLLSREPLAPLVEPGLYHTPLGQPEGPLYRLHLRVEDDGSGVLIVNAATVLHLNASAAAHAALLVRGLDEAAAAHQVARHYRVGERRARADARRVRQQVLAVARTPEIDPVLFLGLDRHEPFAAAPRAPYRLDLALTYTLDVRGTQDPLAPRRVDRELETDEWRAILDAAWAAGVPHVTFTGGDPMLRPDLVELVQHAEDLGQVTGVLTPGPLLADGARLDALAQAGLDHLLITLEASEPDRHPGLAPALASEVFTAVHLTVGEQAAPALRALDRLAEIGVRAVSLSSPTPGPALEQAREHAAHLALELIWDLPAPYSQWNPIRLELPQPPQGAGRAWLYVEPDGDVLPAQGGALPLGNLPREGWEAVWARARAADLHESESVP